VATADERLVRAEQQLADLRRALNRVEELPTPVALLNHRVDELFSDLTVLRGDVKMLNDRLDEREATETRDRKDTRTALWSLVGVLGASLISAGTAVLVALIR
jgi:hypothetical protein